MLSRHMEVKRKCVMVTVQSIRHLLCTHMH